MSASAIVSLADEPDLLDGLVEVERALRAEQHPYGRAPTTGRARAFLVHEWGPVRRRHLAAREHGRVVGMLSLSVRDTDNTRVADPRIAVLPEARRRGTGRALLAEAVRLARADQRRVLVADMPLDGPGETFAAALGARRVYVEQRSLCRLADVPPHVLAVLPAPGHELCGWTGACPEPLLASYARAKVSLWDAPLQDSPLEPERWDGAAARDLERTIERRGLERHVIAATRAGAVVGLTEVVHDRGDPTLGQQQDTLVVPGSRGLGLGLALKAAMVRRLRAERPEVTEVFTWNATDNDRMLDINRRLGFRPLDRGAQWELPLGPPGQVMLAGE